MNSLRTKITVGYYAIATLFMGLAVAVYAELRFIETRITAVEQVTAFFDTALELRRYEKNYFLYFQNLDYQANQHHLLKLETLLQEMPTAFTEITNPKDIREFRAALTDYNRLMMSYVVEEKREVQTNSVLGNQIRKQGKEIVDFAEHLANISQERLRHSLAQHRINVLSAIGVLISLILGAGWLLSRIITLPLQRIEISMDAVAQGNVSRLSIPSKDREITSLTLAFNRVLTELELRRHHLVRSEKLASLGTMLSGVAHELNNPLSNISTSTQILIEELENHDLDFQKELLEQITDQLDRARNIVRSLLDFARHREFFKEWLNLALLVDETIRFIRGQIPNYVVIRNHISANTMLHGDKQQLQQVFINLLKNSAEAMSGPGVIQIFSGVHLSQEPMLTIPPPFQQQPTPYVGKPGTRIVEVIILDTGSGIPAQVLPRIFDPFFTTKEVGKGSGLGLAIVHEIIERHGGCITADSILHTGTLFLLQLPIPTDPESSPASVTPQPHE